MEGAKKYTYLGIPVLFLVGALFHFLYELLGQLAVVGAISPVNESVWEHSKMVVLPLILWWGLYYLIKGKDEGIDKQKWFTGALTSLVSTIIAMPLLFYFYTEAFGVESVVVDILILLVALFIGQTLGYHVYKYGKGLPGNTALLLMLLILIVFIVYTFAPPHLPIFMDSTTGLYGIA